MQMSGARMDGLLSTEPASELNICSFLSSRKCWSHITEGSL